MSNKIIYLFMRGLARFITGFRTNLLTIIMLAALFFVYHVFFTAGVGVSSFLSHISQSNVIRVYLKNDITTKPDELINKVKNIANVKEARYISQKESKKFVVDNAQGVVGLNNFSEDFFPAFIEVAPTNANDKKQMDKIVADIKINEALSVSYGKDYISKFTKISVGSGIFLAFISILFGLCISFVIYNTVRLSLYRFRDEIRLYSLVGATRPFISVPYIIEALLEAIFSFVIATVMFYITFKIFNEGVLHASGINAFEMPSTLYFILTFALVSVSSLLASCVSVVSFLKSASKINDD